MDSGGLLLGEFCNLLSVGWMGQRPLGMAEFPAGNALPSCGGYAGLAGEVGFLNRSSTRCPKLKLALE